jgi:hypothetical protein
MKELPEAQNKYRCIYYSEDNEQRKYSIEPHGEEGKYTLYYGRDCQHHGERLSSTLFMRNLWQIILLIVVTPVVIYIYIKVGK